MDRSKLQGKGAARAASIAGTALALAAAAGCNTQASTGEPVGTVAGAATATVTITGTVTSLPGGAALSGATVRTTGSAQVATATDATGHYTLTVPAPGSYAVSASLTGCSFTPTTANLNNLTANAVQNFAGSGSSCTSAAPPVVGPPGAPGPQGPAGAAGPAGPAGPSTDAFTTSFADPFNPIDTAELQANGVPLAKLTVPTGDYFVSVNLQQGLLTVPPFPGFPSFPVVAQGCFLSPSGAAGSSTFVFDALKIMSFSATVHVTGSPGTISLSCTPADSSQPTQSLQGFSMTAVKLGTVTTQNP
jgi:hypothetical protein